MNYFVRPGSIVRQIWGKADTILFIFAGAAAEFALNKAVDWLYFTGRLPADPLGRLFSTVAYARKIVFSEQGAAEAAIDTIRSIHTGVENSRGASIPDWAYRDVLFMLIDYSIRSFELLERPLSPAEKQEVYDVFYRVGTLMGVKELPYGYPDWLPLRQLHMEQDLAESTYTIDLFRQYRKHLGGPRYLVLRQAQGLVVPPLVRQLLGMSNRKVLAPVVGLYKLARRVGADALVKAVLLPPAFQVQIAELDV
jgi:hypothetical protein